MQCDFIAVLHCVVVTTNGLCVVGSNIQYLIFCHSVAVPLSCCYNMAHLSGVFKTRNME